MKRIAATLFVVLLGPALFASGAGSVPSPAMSSRSPHDMAVDFYNGAERRLEKLTKIHEEMKGAKDAQTAANLQQKINKGLEAAAADFQRAVKNDPNLYQAYSELGFTLRKLGKYNESLDAYNKALEIEPGFSPAIEYRAEAFLGLNQLDEVKKAYTALFGGDRPRADILMVSMKSWITERRANANGLEAQKLDEFAKWVEQRETIAGQTSSLTQATASFRSW
ncbi:MAG TPA: tetratricopeptide repeat protein [Thermoanaerobaculia bacterium]